MVARSESLSPAVEKMLLDHLPLLYWLAHRRYRAGDVNRAGIELEDFVQDVVVELLSSFHRFEAKNVKLSTWIAWKVKDVSRRMHQHILGRQGDAKVLGSTARAGGVDHDRFAAIADPRASDPAAGAALLRVLVPVEELTVGAVSLAWVRDQRTNKQVQVPAADVVTYSGRLFALAVSFDEGEGQEGGELLHRVRFGNDQVAWVRAAVTGG